MRTVASVFFFAILLCCSVSALAQTCNHTEEPSYEAYLVHMEAWQQVYLTSLSFPEHYFDFLEDPEIAIPMVRRLRLRLLGTIEETAVPLDDAEQSRLEAIEAWLEAVDPQEPQRRTLGLAELLEGSGDGPPMRRSIIRRNYRWSP